MNKYDETGAKLTKPELTKSELSGFNYELNQHELFGLQQLTLHKPQVVYEESITSEFDLEISATRVPGGLIYTYQVQDNETALVNLVNTFVPFTDFNIK
jgi:hypothetical protein